MEDCFDESDWSSTDIDRVDITCPSCGGIFAFDAWTLVNARQNPEVVPKIIDGSICEFTCPSCGYSAHLFHPCLYVDPDKKVCIYLVIDEDMALRAEAMFTDLDNKIAATSLCRIVLDRYAFAEKVLTFQEGLDDRALELLKFGIRGSLKAQGLADVDDEVSVHLVGINESGTMSFSVMCGEDVFSSDMERGAYDLFANAIVKSTVADEQPLYVNAAWGEHALDVIEAEGTLD